MPERSATHASLYRCPACHGLSEPVFFVAVGPFLPRLSRRNMIPCALHRGVTIHTAREMPVLSSEFMPRDLGLRVVHLQPSHWQCLALRNTGKIDAAPELLRTLRDGRNASNEYKAVRIALFLSSSTSQLFSSRLSFPPPSIFQFFIQTRPCLSLCQQWSTSSLSVPLRFPSSPPLRSLLTRTTITRPKLSSAAPTWPRWASALWLTAQTSLRLVALRPRTPLAVEPCTTSSASALL